MRMRLKQGAPNLVDGKWVDKWKIKDGRRFIKSRWTLRGFKDLQKNSLAKFAALVGAEKLAANHVAVGSCEFDASSARSITDGGGRRACV